MTTAVAHVRIDEETKERAAETLARLGLSVSDAVRLFLHRVVVEQGMPISFKTPNPATRAAMAEADQIAQPRFATARELLDDVEKAAKRTKGKAAVKK